MIDIRDTVFVTTPGTALRLEGDALRAYQPGVTERRIVPLHRVDSVVAWRGVDVSPDLLRRCGELGIHVTWVSQNGKLVASIAGFEPSRPELRLAQYRAHSDPVERLCLAKHLLAGKLQNARQLLLRSARDATGARQTQLRKLAAEQATALERLGRASNLPEALGAEGQAARSYVSQLGLVVKGATGTRTRRPPLNEVDAHLSAGYALLRSAVHSAVVHTGLDADLGFAHGVRANKPALVLDLMEQFRPLLVDRLIATLFNRGQVRSSFTTRAEGGAVWLSDEGWRHLLSAWVESRQREWPYRGLQRSVMAAELPFLQARALARHLREPERPYSPWVAS